MPVFLNTTVLGGIKMRKLTNGEISNLCMELALLTHSGVGVSDGIHLLADEEKESESKELLREIADKVDEGMTLAEAMESTNRFPQYVSGLIEVGEQSGRSEEALNALSGYYDRRERLVAQIKSAVLYPVILLVLMLAVIGILLVKVLPVFNDVYISLGGRLTGVAGGLLALGQSIYAVLPVLCVILFILVVTAVVTALNSKVRDKLYGYWRSKFGDKGIARRINTARFAQALSMGMCSGLPIEDAFELASSFQKDIPTAYARYQACLDELQQGISLSDALSDKDIFPAASCRMLALGVRSGSGDTVMEEISRRMSEDGEQALEQLVGKVEPTLVVVTSILVGIILLSVMLPLMNIMSAIG